MGSCVRKDIKIVRLRCEKRSQSFPKKGQKTAFSSFFDFLKNSIRFKRNFLQSFSTPKYGSICAISINSYDWVSTESEGKDLSRLLYRICGGSGLGCDTNEPKLPTKTES